MLILPSNEVIHMRLKLEQKTILITGVAGFIGSCLAKQLLSTISAVKIIGIDNLNDYYDVKLKESRLVKLRLYPNFVFLKGDLADKSFVEKVFTQHSPQLVVHLAAQAGVRYSLVNPDAYISSNLVGFFHILEGCRHLKETAGHPVEHLVYASSSSVYGNNRKLPYSVGDPVDHPVSLYAATKKSNELMAHAYSKLYEIPSTGLRFFTVYGPAGRPDMAYFRFTDQLVQGKTIQIFNYGNCKRDFTYIDDIIEGVIQVMKKPPTSGEETVPYKIYNIGNHHPENLLDFLEILKQELIHAQVLPRNYDFQAHTQLVPMQPGDVEETYADIDDLIRDFNFRPHTSLREGLRTFAFWYKRYRGGIL